MSSTQRWTLVAAIIGSGAVFLDGTVVNLALKTIGQELPATVVGVLEGQTYIVSGYLAVLAALLILGGALSDHYGRRRVFAIGLALFAITSALCGLSPTMEFLILSRLLQGAAGALLVPGSLALISACFEGPERGRAFGIWAAATSALTLTGPILSGLLVDTIGWRVAFLVNVPILGFALWVTLTHVQETRDRSAGRRFDWLGSAVAAIAVGGLSAGLIRGQEQAWADPLAWVLIAVVAFASVSSSEDALSDKFELPGRESTHAANAIYDELGTGGPRVNGPLNAVVQLPEGTTIDSPGVEEQVGAAFAKIAYDTAWLKLEVVGDEYTLQPDPYELVVAAQELVREGFTVFPYCTDDLVTCQRLLDVGCPLLMPWGAPIGSGQGLVNPFALRTLRERLPDTVLIIDAGIGAPSHAAQAMELGFDAVLLNSAVSQASEPVRMAGAFRQAVEAGRDAWLAGVMAKQDYAVASTPVTGNPFLLNPAASAGGLVLPGAGSAGGTR